MKRVVFDTDIGIDDAMALLFLDASPGVRLEAICTIAGNASIDNTTRNACHVCERFSLQTPIFRGSAQCLNGLENDDFPDFVHGQNGLGDIELSEPTYSAELEPAPEAIARLARENPGELSIVSVGRVTNLAIALQLEPRLPTLLREVILMGGVFMRNEQGGNVSPVAEANIAGDPGAADLILGSGLRATLVGLDVTHLTTMDESFIHQLREGGGARGRFIHSITRHYFDFYEGIYGRRECPIHDSSAVAYLLQPELFETCTGPVRVVTEGIARGQTIMARSGARYQTDAWEGREPVTACVGVDAPAVRQLYLDTLLSASELR
ncbi:MAG: nucleoside hydrolase [Pseudomonadota bacterium]